MAHVERDRRALQVVKRERLLDRTAGVAHLDAVVRAAVHRVVADGNGARRRLKTADRADVAAFGHLNGAGRQPQHWVDGLLGLLCKGLGCQAFRAWDARPLGTWAYGARAWDARPFGTRAYGARAWDARPLGTWAALAGMGMQL
eukprot:363793-Chlamydomonas_euryale.AAC.7